MPKSKKRVRSNSFEGRTRTKRLRAERRTNDENEVDADLNEHKNQIRKLEEDSLRNRVSKFCDTVAKALKEIERELNVKVDRICVRVALNYPAKAEDMALKYKKQRKNPKQWLGEQRARHYRGTLFVRFLKMIEQVSEQLETESKEKPDTEIIQAARLKILYRVLQATCKASSGQATEQKVILTSSVVMKNSDFREILSRLLQEKVVETDQLDSVKQRVEAAYERIASRRRSLQQHHETKRQEKSVSDFASSNGPSRGHRLTKSIATNSRRWSMPPRAQTQRAWQNNRVIGPYSEWIPRIPPHRYFNGPFGSFDWGGTAMPPPAFQTSQIALSVQGLPRESNNQVSSLLSGQPPFPVQIDSLSFTRKA